MNTLLTVYDEKILLRFSLATKEIAFHAAAFLLITFQYLKKFTKENRLRTYKQKQKGKSFSLFLQGIYLIFEQFFSFFSRSEAWSSSLVPINQQTCHARHKLKIHVKEFELEVTTKEWTTYIPFPRTNHNNDP